jgi:hypothetical protein
MNKARVAKLVAMLGSSNENEANVALTKLRAELSPSEFTDIAACIKTGQTMSIAELWQAF